MDLPNQDIESLKKEVLRKMLTKEAMERLGRVRLVKPLLAQQLELYLIQLYQAGQLKEMIDDAKLRNILSILSEKKDWKIKM
ncbi:MAG TPA: hypothetical protein ENF95_00965 [Candidatus Aenigmarchaeota archaeon]|nr:hypothetical protein [Candidatus Aenigmarchaeota archaeon]